MQGVKMEKTFNVRSEWGEKDPFRLAAVWHNDLRRDDLPDPDGWMYPVTANSLNCGFDVLGWRNIERAFWHAYDAASGRRHRRDTVRRVMKSVAWDFVKDTRGVPATMVASVDARAFLCA